jgi:hypothetical protein
MPYQYGMQNSPSGGNGLGGLPKKQTTPQTVNFTRVVTAGSGTIVPPANAKYMRVAVIGAGGSISTTGAGFGAAGAGCAASKIVPASPISYFVGSAVLSGTYKGEDSTATFPGYFLIGGGGGGRTSNTVVAAGGVGSGGDYNFEGGATQTGSTTGGGGAAGPNGNGGRGCAVRDGVSLKPGEDGVFSGTGWGVGGGGGGAAGTDVSACAGGGGAGAQGGIHPGVSTTSAAPSNSPTPCFGGPADGRTAGVMGGGTGGRATSGTAAGGVGGIVVEWFYD